MKFLALLIHTNIYIALAAVALTFSSQIHLGIRPQFHPYLFLIFFATLFEYNLHRLITILTNPQALLSNKHNWVKDKLNWFYGLMFLSLLGLGISVLAVELQVLLTLMPIALLTLFYSTPLTRSAQGIFRLRQIPYLKIFIIALVWTLVTLLIPVMHAKTSCSFHSIVILGIERFLFLFAITIPFDIRDMKADHAAGLKTIPLQIGEAKSVQLSILILVVLLVWTVGRYSFLQQWGIAFAYAISGLTTLLFLTNKRIQKWSLYHYGALDGTLLIQGILMIILYYLAF